ncbi:hypothetical protein BRO54_3525 [Geobacillus proteiniphilus]|uniref:Uncharacterized protein n=1 Tax=Geobacillus proteiniphilus TaxID=860353 RepID=A0A1Q5SL86_9BACL|nr:hypothetical protein BRO54_3525 [Geobacillus proteiniphilus]
MNDEYNKILPRQDKLGKNKAKKQPLDILKDLFIIAFVVKLKNR